jgi:predicted transcriptional regulator
MNLEDLRYEVQRLDGEPDSALQAIGLLIESLNDKGMDPPRSIVYGFFEEFYKCLIDWMGRGETKKLTTTYHSIKAIINRDEDLLAPFAGVSSKRRFGASLHVLTDMIEVYLRSDMEIKDYNDLLGPGKQRRRLRQLLLALLEMDTLISVNKIAAHPLYNKDKDSYKTALRHLDRLSELGFLTKESDSKLLQYRLARKTWSFRDKLQEMVDLEEEIARPADTEDETTPDPSHQQLPSEEKIKAQSSFTFHKIQNAQAVKS